LSSKRLMQRSPEVKVLKAWGRLTLWVSHHRPITRLVSLTTGLGLFILFLPSYMRIAFWDGLQSHKTLASMLLVFSLLAISLVWSTGQHLDAWAFLFFNVRGPRPIWLDRIMLGFTQIGSGIAALGIALVLFLASDHLLSYELVLGTLTLWLVVELVKFVVHRSRPFIRLAQARIVGYRAIGRSFPSGHTSQAFFMATLMAQHFHFSVWVVFLLYAAALLVGITRMYVGAHYPRDVLAGAILGSAWGLLGVMVNRYVLNGIW
jgi:membrane-associated phospholipid phosphatase